MDGLFKNPSKLPIHDLNLGNENIPALSPKWLDTSIPRPKYVPLKLQKGKIASDFNITDWIDDAKIFNNYLEWILGLEFHRFWSHVVFDNIFLDPLAYFLQESTPFYIPLKQILNNDDHFELYNKICRNALVITLRLITNRESEDKFMSKEKQAQILYENFIISMPMIFDMIALYGFASKDLMQKFIDTLIRVEPKYVNDLKSGMKILENSFATMSEELEKIDDQNREKFDKYEDLSLYLMNVAATLNIMTEIVPNEVKAYSTRELHLEASIANFYDNFVASLYQNSHAVDPNAYFLSFINYSRVELINAFRNLVNRPILTIFGASEKNRHKISDEILSIFSECAGYPVFIADYVKLFPIEMDLDVVTQCDGKKIDKIKFEFVQSAFGADTSSSSVANGYHLSAHSKEESSEDDEEEMEGACALPLKKEVKEKPKDIEDVLQIETAKILELFCDLGTGYIRKLLAFYDNSSETVIAKIVEDTLDSKFKNADKTEPYIPPEDTLEPPVNPNKTELINYYGKLYGNDNFDILKNGKNYTTQQPKTANEVLEDKSHINQLRERYQQYSLISDENDREYDDEYDDSYEVFSATEPKIHIRGKMRDELPDDISESSESEEETQKNPLNFCENPEAIRARREQEYQARVAKKHPNRPQKTRDVVGTAKGQGQSDDVLKNRAQKNTNKSSRANHNRKAGSTFKQSRGMY